MERKEKWINLIKNELNIQNLGVHSGPEIHIIFSDRVSLRAFADVLRN